jgi:adenylate cyclase
VVAPGLVVTALLFVLHIVNPPILSIAGNLIFDAYQRIAPREYLDSPVRVVDIDDETLERLGQWPWPRTEVARLTETLVGAGAAVVAFDIVFSEPDRTSPARVAEILAQNPAATGDYSELNALIDHDLVLGQTMAATNSVLGVFLTHEANGVLPPQKAGFAYNGSIPMEAVDSYEGALVPLPEIVDPAAGAGFVSIGREGDNLIREAPLVARVGETFVPSLAIEALRAAQGAGAIQIKSSDGGAEYAGRGPVSVVAVKVGDFEVPTTASGALRMYFAAPRPERQVPAWRVMTGDLTQPELESLFAGHIVFVGAGAQGLRDIVSTPIRDSELGVNVHAEIVEQILNQQFVQRPDWWPGVERMLILGLGLLVALVLPRLEALISGALAIAGVLTIIVASWFAFRNAGMLLDPTFLVLGLAAPYVVGTTVSFYREERARAYIRNAFDRYLSPELVARIAKDPSQLELGGEERDMTVMFCDIRSFSHISESLAPQQIIGFLIEFLTPMTDILTARKATIDKYIGDAILAFWNAPLDDPDHPRNAAFSALEMIERLESLNAEKIGAADAVWPGEVKIGIGLNTGPCCVGNMGSARRLNYSLIGDTVNLASRIEGLTKVYGVKIALGEDMAVRIEDFALIEIDLAKVVGRDTPERLFALLGSPEMAKSEAFFNLANAWSQVLAAYRKQDWDGADAALDTFSPLAGDFDVERLGGLYRERIAAYRAAPPGEDWDGVYQAVSK